MAEGIQPAAVVEQVIRALFWPDEAGRVFELYVLLDAARDERIFPYVRRAELYRRCLYDGPLPGEFLRSAPHLVMLSPISAMTNQLIAEGWGRSWGIFLRSRVEPEVLRDHLRGMLQVMTEVGKPMFFRFFDPRVLASYLPTCTGRELAQFFGPVERFAVESDEASVLEYTVAGGKLAVRRMRIAGGEPV